MAEAGGRLTLRTSLLASLLALAVAMSLLFLLLVQTAGRRQIQRSLNDDVVRSLETFRRIQQQRQQFLAAESRLLADLPSLKALLTTTDPATVQDGAAQYWRTSGSDLLALLGPAGDLQALYANGAALDRGAVAALLRHTLTPLHTPNLLLAGRLFRIASSPVYFTTGSRNLLLGYVVVGYEVDRRVAEETGRASTSQVILLTGGRSVASTLAQPLTPAQAAQLSQPGRSTAEITLAGETYLASAMPLDSGADGPPVTLVLLKPVDEATLLLSQLNRGILALALVAVLAGTALAFWLSASVTRPLQALLKSTRAFSSGHMEQPVPTGGPRELRELGIAFESMRVELVRKQSELLASERLATIGRMASSVSHDLRHYLSPIYANAEFLGSPRISPPEHAELLEEILTAARGMTDLLDSLLIFSRTGELLRPETMPLDGVLTRAVAAVRAHPAARGVEFRVNGLSPVLASIDANQLRRAVYNLLLNACQAPSPVVELALESTPALLSIQVRDYGPGVPQAFCERLFQPFTSQGKESGIGLGLAIVKRVAEAHGGSVSMRRTMQPQGWRTEFSIELPAAEPSLAGLAKEDPA